jgi:uncharacterized membrane protein
MACKRSAVRSRLAPPTKTRSYIAATVGPRRITNPACAGTFSATDVLTFQRHRSMLSSNPRSTASFRGHSLHALLVPIPIACFMATLVTDIVYWQTAAMLWADMSAWLLTVGLIVSVLAVAAGLIDFFGDDRIRTFRAAWIHVVGNAAALVLSIINALIHTRDAYTSVVPAGLILSALVVLILLVTGWNGWSLVSRHRVGVAPEDSP